MMPIFSHQEDDLDSFRTITCQLYTNGSAGQTQIAEAFGIKVQALKRWVKRFREKGSNTFYRPPETRGNSTVLTPEVRTKAQLLLDTGTSVSETARELDIGYDTVRKTIADGRLTKKKTAQNDDPNQSPPLAVESAPGPAVRRSQLL